MSDLFSLSSSILIGITAGVAIGAFYFGGLWLTVRRIAIARQPAPLFLMSFLVRTLISLGALYWIVDGSIVRALAGVAGVLVARTVMIGYWGPPDAVGSLVQRMEQS